MDKKLAKCLDCTQVFASFDQDHTKYRNSCIDGNMHRFLIVTEAEIFRASHGPDAVFWSLMENTQTGQITGLRTQSFGDFAEVEIVDRKYGGLAKSICFYKKDLNQGYKFKITLEIGSNRPLFNIEEVKIYKNMHRGNYAPCRLADPNWEQVGSLLYGVENSPLLYMTIQDRNNQKNDMLRV